MMNFCRKPFEQLYISDSYVKTCPWTNLILGNPMETPIEELWMNEKAEEIRDSIRDGSFRYCRKEECPWCASGKLETMEDSEVKNYRAEKTPLDISVSYDRFCNHSCPSCRKAVFVPDQAYKDKMAKMKDIVLPIANRTKRVSTCGMGDCFSSPFIMEFLKELKPIDPEFSISFETNGVMLDEKHWDMISNLHGYPMNVTVTPNSFEKYTYMYLTGGHDNVEKSKKNLKFISELRKAGEITSFKINMVVQESNYWEIPSFIERCLQEYDPDIIQIKPLNRWFCLNAADYWYKNVLNPMHPYHTNYLKVMQHPILQHPKVWDWTTESHDRAPKHHPAVYNEAYTDFIWNMLNQENDTEIISKYLQSRHIRSIGIYGAWKYGEICYEILNKIPGIEIKYFIDRYKGNRGLQCRGLEIKGTWEGNDFQDVDAIFISVLSVYDEIKRDLISSGYCGEILSIKDFSGGSAS